MRARWDRQRLVAPQPFYLGAVNLQIAPACDSYPLIAHCGLPWDEACLSFHTTSRSVRTASAIQVRRPLYRNAIGRAKPYAVWLEPLRAALEGR